MPISFIPEEEKREKKVLKVPFFIWWILIPIFILGAILYFIFQKMPESEIVVEPQAIGLSIEELQKIEVSLKMFENKKIKSLLQELKENPFPKNPKVPPDKIGRPDPFKSLVTKTSPKTD